MLEDRIIVQDRGIDAGLAALIQNANKGNMDPAALMAMMNNNGMGGNGGWWWIWIILIFFCWDGETKKFTIPENKSVITDNSIGLTISTDKQEIINIVRNQYDTYKQRKEAIAKCDEEMAKCQVLLDKLGVDNEPARENDKILELQKEVSELKNIIRKANQMVPPPMKEMLPQDMKNAMDKVGQ